MGGENFNGLLVDMPLAVTATAVVMPLTATGDEELVVVPLPSEPSRLYPQHLIVPSASNAQV